MPVNGKAAASISVGALFLYSGIKGFSVLQAVQNVVTGKPANIGQSSRSLFDPTLAQPIPSGLTGTGTVGGIQMAQDEQLYVGHAYQYGGAPGPFATDPWDCSSMQNWIIGKSFGLDIPLFKAGTYDGTSHGPPTMVWLGWNGCRTVPESTAQMGDLLVWQTHMGMWIGPNLMVSALNKKDGTRITPIHGQNGGAPGGEVLFVRRLLALGG